MLNFLIFIGMALVTYLTRSSMFFALEHQTLIQKFEEHPSLRRWLRYVPPAVLSTLILPEIIVKQGHLQIGLPLWSTLAGAIVAWRTRSVVWTIITGMITFWIFQYLCP